MNVAAAVATPPDQSRTLFRVKLLNAPPDP